MMRDVLRIAMKDFQIQKNSALKYLIAGFVFVLAFSLFGGLQSQMLFSMAFFILIYRYINTALYEDEKNNSLRLLVSLPVKRDTIVLARYLSTGIFILVLAVLMGAALAFTSMGAREAGDSAIVAIFTFLAFIIMISVYMPLGFKLGYFKAVNLNRVLFLAIFAIFGAVPLLLKNLPGGQTPESAARLGEMLEAADPALVIAGFAIFTILVYIVSMRISIGLFKKRLLF